MNSSGTHSIDKSCSRVAGTKWLLIGIIFLGTIIRLYNIDTWVMFQDELYTLRDARAFGEHINFLRPFYYLLQHLLLEISSPTPLFLRLPPFLFGIIGIWLTFLLGRRNFGDVAGLISALLVATSPLHLYTSQLARYWTLVYALAAFFYFILPQAFDSDRPRNYLLSLSILAIGTMTHPTFLFPVVGTLIAVLTFDSNGKFGQRSPSRLSWIYFWGPLGIFFLIGLTVCHITGSLYTLVDGRGGAAILRLVPGIVQWIGPSVVVVAILGACFFLYNNYSSDRRWGVMGSLGCLCAIVLLVGLSFRVSIYSLYVMAMLPLVYVTIGGFIQRMGELMTSRSCWLISTSVLVLIATVLPGVLSHLSDGTRFDYRPAYSHIQQTGSSSLVLCRHRVIQKYYAPDLNSKQLKTDPSYLDNILKEVSGFWLIAASRRYGLGKDHDGNGARWIYANCRKVLETQKPRLDYRTYKVELHWCGSDSPQSSM